MKADAELNAIITQHNTLVACYKETIAIKKAYLAELREELVAGKVELANSIYANLERLHMKARASQFHTADLMGVERVEVVALDNRTLAESDSSRFATLNEELLSHVAALIADHRLFVIRLHLLAPSKSENRYAHRDTFYEQCSPSSTKRSRSFMMRDTGLSDPDDDLSTSGGIASLTASTEAYERLVVLKSGKRLRAEVQAQLSSTFVPASLKYCVYARLLPNHNCVDQLFFEYYSRVDARMPRHVERIIAENVRSAFCAFNYFNASLEEQVMRTLRLFYSYRPDVGYKPGMEVYAIVLGTCVADEKLLRLFMSLLLDSDLLFGVYKAADGVLDVYHASVAAELLQMKRVDLAGYSELINQFFAYSVSAFFSFAFALSSLKKLMDVLVAFGCRALTTLYVELLMHVETKELAKAQNCYQLDRIVAAKVKGLCEKKVLKNLIDKLRGN